jgi:hypothetical protein
MQKHHTKLFRRLRRDNYRVAVEAKLSFNRGARRWLPFCSQLTLRGRQAFGFV